MYSLKIELPKIISNNNGRSKMQDKLDKITNIVFFTLNRTKKSTPPPPAKNVPTL